MFVKQLTEQELIEYERQLQGVTDSVAQLAANDEGTRESVHAFLAVARDLQGLLKGQIAEFHQEPASPRTPDPD